MTKINVYALWLSIVLSMNACSTQQVYKGIQDNRKQVCEKEPNDAAREECLKGLDTDYEEYQRQREALPE